MIGQTLGHYRIVEKIGEGGMGVVYRARDEHLDRDVALKVLPAGTLLSGAARKRFRQEALTLAKLNHAHIAAVYEFDTHDGVDFLVMEYVTGQPLADKLAGGGLPQKEVVKLGQQVAAALEEAHSRGVVHCDLKPGNIVLTPKGQAKVLDFGLAKLLHPAEQTAGEGLTETSVISGTVPYMAPEQLRGEPVDARTDIYALGVVLYEMATGQRPFRDRLVTRLADAILHEPPVSPRAVNPRVWLDLERAILKCLEKDPQDRYQSAQELGVDLRRLGTAMSATPARLGARAPTQQRHTWLFVAGAVALLALLAMWTVGRLRELRTGKLGRSAIRSVAVLPLANLSGDPEEGYFADGMTDALITEMSKVSALRVISRTSVMQYRQSQKSVGEIARELKVEALVEGSVLRADNRVRITVQLTDAVADRNLWAEKYDREIGDVLALQAEVARAIVQEIRITLTPQEQALLSSSRPVNPESYRAYLKGRFYVSQRTPEGLVKGLDYYQQALAGDPKYALAYAGLADAYLLMPTYELIPSKEAMPKSAAAARKALELDPTLAEAHTSLAEITSSFDWDLTGAEKEFQRAIELNPGYAVAHHWYALHLAATGRHEKAIAEIKRALDLDPLSPIINANVAWCYYLARQYNEAIDQAKKTLELFPEFAVAHEYLGQAYTEKAMFQEAIAELQKAAALSGRGPIEHPAIGYVYAVSGKRAEALALLRELKSGTNWFSSYWIAGVYAGLGDADHAMQRLQKSYEERDTRLLNLNVHPMFDRIRADARFQDLLRRLGLASEPGAEKQRGARNILPTGAALAKKRISALERSPVAWPRRPVAGGGPRSDTSRIEH